MPHVVRAGSLPPFVLAATASAGQHIADHLCQSFSLVLRQEAHSHDPQNCLYLSLLDMFRQPSPVPSCSEQAQLVPICLTSTSPLPVSLSS